MSTASTVAALRKEMDKYGATIAVEGDDLVVHSDATLPAPLIASLRRFKPVLIKGLRSAGSLADVSDRCACGSLVFYYRPDSTPLCERHSPRWVGGCALADLAGELAPRVHFTIHASDDSDSDLDHLRELFHILDLYPGANTISIRIVELDGQATWFERQALASKQLRLQLATTIRDRALALRARKDAA